jgi:hypothetical protein
MRIIIELDHTAPAPSGERSGVEVTTAEAQASTERDAGRFAGVPGVDAPSAGEQVGAAAEGGPAEPVPAGAAPIIVDNPPMGSFTAEVGASVNGESSG